jgi:hypothetical protein
MGIKYDQIKDFEYSLHIHAYKHFNKQITLFEEVMELLIEPTEELSNKWQFKHGKSPRMMLIARMFNDFESSRLLLLNGLPEQAITHMRDAIECMMLFRLFGKDSKRAKRWMKNLKEYRPSDVKKRLDELKIDCPEYAFYGMLSQLTHVNLLSVVSHVTDKRLSENLILETYHFGGINNPTWIGLVFNNLFIFIFMALMTVLPPVYLPSMKNPQEWWDKVVGLKAKLGGFVEGIEFEEPENEEEKMVFKKLGMAKIKTALFDKEKIASDKGFQN